MGFIACGPILCDPDGWRNRQRGTGEDARHPWLGDRSRVSSSLAAAIGAEDDDHLIAEVFRRDESWKTIGRSDDPTGACPG
jgi:hypothetical protein